MKKGTIFRNLWAGHETYFVYQGSIPARGMRSATSYGYKLCFIPTAKSGRFLKLPTTRGIWRTTGSISPWLGR